MAALSERVGERVRVPEEVRSVAADVRRQMEERTDKGRLIAFLGRWALGFRHRAVW